MTQAILFQQFPVSITPCSHELDVFSQLKHHSSLPSRAEDEKIGEVLRAIICRTDVAGLQEQIPCRSLIEARDAHDEWPRWDEDQVRR